MSHRDGPGVVHLVGAGPGAADLITVRGHRLVMTCDALVYDHLVDAELVNVSPAKIKINVGKKPGQHNIRQSSINDVLVDLATRPFGPRRIVRLKGGDPFLFGRGGEEVIACLSRGIPVSVVPGVSAGVAGPAAAGIPLTHRDFTRGAVLVTGHTHDGGALDLPWKELASTGFTLVFFMGVATLSRITAKLIEHGLAPKTPSVVVQEATTPSQKVVIADVSTIAEAAANAGIRAPAVLVVGQVAGMAQMGRRDVRFDVNAGTVFHGVVEGCVGSLPSDA